MLSNQATGIADTQRAVHGPRSCIDRRCIGASFVAGPQRAQSRTTRHVPNLGIATVGAHRENVAVRVPTQTRHEATAAAAHAFTLLFQVQQELSFPCFTIPRVHGRLQRNRNHILARPVEQIHIKVRHNRWRIEHTFRRRRDPTTSRG